MVGRRPLATARLNGVATEQYGCRGGHEQRSHHGRPDTRAPLLRLLFDKALLSVEHDQPDSPENRTEGHKD